MSREHEPRYSDYDDTSLIKKRITERSNRGIIGGKWEELGKLQLDFLVQNGLKPYHKFVDIGSGSFRAGVKLIPYLDAGNYFAIDSQASLLESGYTNEIEPCGLSSRFPRRNFVANRDFDISGFGCLFDYGIAQSVFTHMPLYRLVDCLKAVAPYFADGGVLFVTLFLVSEAEFGRSVRHKPGKIVSYADKDPFHTSISALHNEVEQTKADWSMSIIGDWRHPRDQMMVQFTKRPH